MIDSIANLVDSAEFLSIDGWNEILQTQDLLDQTLRLADINDPLAKVGFSGIEPLAVYGFHGSGDSWSIVYFWSSILDEQAGIDWGHPDGTLFEHVTFGHVLSKVCDEEYTLSLLTRVHKHTNKKWSFLRDGGDIHLYWCGFGETKFASLFKSNADGDRFRAEAIGDCVTFHYDYFRLRLSVWNSVPLNYLAVLCRADPSLFGRLLLQPKCFDPRTERGEREKFLWPWQRSMRFDASSNFVANRGIPTTSLAFDIRKSTMILEQLVLQERGRFPSFIRELCAIAKSAVLSNGGFFDKETGDGIVGHFCDFGLELPDHRTPSMRAFCAAREILTEIRPLCEDIQRCLNLGVGGLGGSIGIHSSDAVWARDDSLISALGESIILAARLCNEAENFSIFVSNSEFHRLGSELPPSLLLKFKRREYTGKEWNSGAQLYGMSFAT